MRFELPQLPAGWPWSLWFFVATLVVYLLQRFPLTGVFLMIVGAAFWSIILINLGVLGVGFEALAGRVSRLWLILPLLYFGIYYLLYARNQAALASVRVEYAAFNRGKSLPFDPAAQDLFVGDDNGGAVIQVNSFVPYYGLKRAFGSNGRMVLVGNAEACALLRGNDVYRSAGIYSTGFYNDRSARRPQAPGLCMITAPGQPDRPIVRVTGESNETKHGGLPVTVQTFRIKDEAAGREIIVKSARAGPLKRFPMPVMGCALNSGAPSWDCFHGFMRDSWTPVEPAGPKYGGATVVVAAALGLKRLEDFSTVATGPERFKAIADAADAKLVAKELAILERMLANPTAHQKDGWFYHLPNRPEIIAPYAARIFAGLRTLQGSDAQGSETGRNLWRLAAALPEPALAPFHAEVVEWLKPVNARPWTEDTGDIYTRLNGANPVEREIILNRLETRSGDLEGDLLRSFCRMGADAPGDAKQRLLALWRKRGVDTKNPNGERGRDDVPLYFTLARIGLKAEAGKIDQRYFRPTFLGIWNEVTPQFPDDLCSGSINDISNRFRRR